MRYNKRLNFITQDSQTGEYVNHDAIYPVNVTSMGIKSQMAVFGSVKQGRVSVRFQNKISQRKDYFVIDGQHYQIEQNSTTDRGTTIYGVEYHGRL